MAKPGQNVLTASRLYVEWFFDRLGPNHVTFTVVVEMWWWKFVALRASAAWVFWLLWKKIRGPVPGLSRSRAWRLLRQIQLIAFLVQCMQALLPADFPWRAKFCRWMLQQNAESRHAAVVSYRWSVIYSKRDTQNWQCTCQGTWKPAGSSLRSFPTPFLLERLDRNCWLPPNSTVRIAKSNFFAMNYPAFMKMFL